jgi:hypothetical protein
MSRAVRINSRLATFAKTQQWPLHTEQARDELRRVVGFSAADEIEKLDRLKKTGTISDAEFTRLRARLVQ